MKPEERWKDGPGRMEFGESVTLKGLTGRFGNVRVSFNVFGSHVEYVWNYDDGDFTLRHSDRTLSDEQKKYLQFLTVLFAITSYKSIRASFENND